MAAGPLQPSGRVIAGGRLLLACLFLIAIWADKSQPAHATVATYAVLGAYVAWSLTVTLLVWNDWWQDARLAAPAHVADVAVFMLMLYATAGYTSPYFIFFIFILLSAAIRWGWRETAVTAAAIIAIYVAAGLTIGPSPEMEIERFIIRTGHLFIISAILIWFGAHRWAASPGLGLRRDAADPVGGDPFIASLQAGMTALDARRGTLFWREAIDREVDVVRITGDGPSRSSTGATALLELPGSFLFDLDKDRLLMRADASRWRFLSAAATLPPAFRAQSGGAEGFAVPISTGAAEGYAIFQDIRDLCTDHLDLAPRLAREMAIRLQEAELFAAVEERSMAKARVAVARDLHDSVVQFLAGLGFRLEALRRSPATAGEFRETLADLKDTVMDEQRQLRAFIRGLRAGNPIPFSELSRDCASLCELLARQWDVDCTYSCEAELGLIPVRIQLEIQQLMREAVANAVRHGSANRVAVSLGGDKDHICLRIADDGRGFPETPAGDEAAAPASLSGRVREARGELTVNSAAGATSVTIRLPLEAAA